MAPKRIQGTEMLLLREKGESAELFSLLSRWGLSCRCLLGRRIASHDRRIWCLQNEG